MQNPDTNPYARTMFEAITLCSETNMQIWRHLLNYAAGTAKESLHLATELQTSALEAVQHGQAYMLQRLNALPEAATNPPGYYQQSIQAGSDTAEQVYKLHLGNTQVTMRSAEQMGILAQQASTRIQESCKEWADKLKSLYMPA